MATPERGPFIGYTARARWERVRIVTEDGVYVGRVFVPETKKRLSDVLCDDRPFLNLTDVSVNDSPVMESFIALNKRYIRAVRVLQESTDGDVIPIGPPTYQS